MEIDSKPSGSDMHLLSQCRKDHGEAIVMQ